jgi:hypothetical protein
MKKPPHGAARTRTRGHVRYGMMMNAARSPEVFTVLLIDRSFNPLAGAPSTSATSKRRLRHPNDRSGCGKTCARTVDDATFLVSKRKVRGITLGIRKYPLTWGFTFAKVSDVPDSACRPGLRHRVCRTKPQGGGRRKTGLGPRGESGFGRGETPHGYARPGARFTGRNGGVVRSGSVGGHPN